jgi:heat-inducible transcriptional repressor
MIDDLNQRSLAIFKELVETYVEIGEPVGSRTLSKKIRRENLSPATIRNVMSDLEDAGLLYAPHTSAGRVPTAKGLRFFVSGLLEISDLDTTDKNVLSDSCQDHTASSLLDVLTGLSGCAGVVMAPKSDPLLNQIDFVPISSTRALVVLTAKDGNVENRIIDIPEGMSTSTLEKASRYLSYRLPGHNLTTFTCMIQEEMAQHRLNMDESTSLLIQKGLAVWVDDQHERHLIVKGQSQLLNHVTHIDELNHIKKLFEILEEKEKFCQLLDASIKGDGIQIFIGADNDLFSVSGCSLIVSPFKNSQEKIMGAIGVVGPSRMAYGRVIPLVNYTAKLFSHSHFRLNLSQK